MRKLQTLSPKSVAVWRITVLFSLLFYALVLAGYTLMVHLFDWWLWCLYLLITLAVVLAGLELIWIPKLKFERFRYDMNQDDVYITEGIIVATETIVPMTKVQYVNTEQGPILKAFQLATVRISTGATTHVIPCVDEPFAKQLRDEIAVLARVTDDDQ